MEFNDDDKNTSTVRMYLVKSPLIGRVFVPRMQFKLEATSEIDQSINIEKSFLEE